MTKSRADYEKLRISIERGVAKVTFHNPPLNLVDRVLFRDLRRALEQLEQDDAVRVIVFCSDVPGWFIAHYDITLIQAAPPITEKRTEPWLLQQMTERLRTMPKATIAVLEGRTGGGGSELALSCDMRFASPSAIINQPEVALGLLPAGSGSQRLPRLVGRSRALEIILGCDDIDARTAESWGLVNRVIPDDQLWLFVTRLTLRMASYPADALKAAKAAVLQHEGNLDADLVKEVNAIDELMGRQETQATLERFLAIGGQTEEGERRLGELAGEIARATDLDDETAH